MEKKLAECKLAETDDWVIFVEGLKTRAQQSNQPTSLQRQLFWLAQPSYAFPPRTSFHLVRFYVSKCLSLRFQCACLLVVRSLFRPRSGRRIFLEVAVLG